MLLGVEDNAHARLGACVGGVRIEDGSVKLLVLVRYKEPRVECKAQCVYGWIRLGCVLR